jgi:broad specificity phosphatase PhoE
MLRRLLLALALLAPAFTGPLPAQGGPITVFIVRHAEKGPGAPDPSLTDAGRQRAAELVRTVGDAHPTALFATEFKRTQETLDPLAKATGLTVTVTLARDVDGLLAKIHALPAGSRAVVATHSNLVDVIVEKLSGVKVPALTDADYDRLVVVTVPAGGKGAAVVLRYGAP